MRKSPEVAILLPCYNEELTIAAVIQQMRTALPAARLIVFDNNSTDKSIELARAAGAEVRCVPLQGKGNVVRRMFADVEADVYLMLDADTTYDPATAQALIDAVVSGEADMAIGVRKGADSAFPSGHRWGNRLFNLIVGSLFGRGMQDIFSGYRAFSYRFAKSFPSHSSGFEIETELSVFTLEQSIPFVEIPSPYGERPEGSFSKLKTFRDGFRILFTIGLLYKELRPMMFFGLMSVVVALAALAVGVPVVLEWMHTGTVERIGSAVLSSGLGIVAGIIFVAGMVLNSVARAYRESRHLCYLNVRR